MNLLVCIMDVSDRTKCPVKLAEVSAADFWQMFPVTTTSEVKKCFLVHLNGHETLCILMYDLDIFEPNEGKRISFKSIITL